MAFGLLITVISSETFLAMDGFLKIGLIRVIFKGYKRFSVGGNDAVSKILIVEILID